MADRTMKAGDTWPPLKGMASDSSGNALDLSGAHSRTVVCTSGAHIITGAAVAIWPPEADPDGIHFWNWKYVFVVGDTDNPGDYDVELKVVWDVGETEKETFPNEGSNTLTIEAT